MSDEKKSPDKVKDLADKKIEEQTAEQIKGGRMKQNPPKG